jgi:hypothetical protein
MSFDDLVTGVVIRYSYLWKHQAELGETEGRKNLRPTVVGFRHKRASGKDVIWLFPITSKLPHPQRFSREIPDIEKRRAGLEVDLRLWIILDEFNEDIIGESYHLLPEAQVGKLSRAFIIPILKEFIARRANSLSTNRAK